MKAPRKVHRDGEQNLVSFDLEDPETGALFWSGVEGYVLKLPDVDDEESLPIPLYLLGLCFMRLNNDPDFAQELLAWSRRKIH